MLLSLQIFHIRQNKVHVIISNYFFFIKQCIFQFTEVKNSDVRIFVITKDWFDRRDFLISEDDLNRD
jgi:hypothetical protein